MSLSWLPNAISIMRIALVPPILILILQGDYGWALALFWFAGFSESGRYQLLVARVDGVTAGYAYSSRFKDRPAYDISVETTVYVDPGHLGSRIGSTLYEELFARLTDCDLHGAYAGITLPNDASVRLHERFGFQRIGVETEVGFKFDRYWSVARYERRL